MVPRSFSYVMVLKKPLEMLLYSTIVLPLRSLRVNESVVTGPGIKNAMGRPSVGTFASYGERTPPLHVWHCPCLCTCLRLGTYCTLPSIYGNEESHTCQFNAVDFFHAESCSKPELIKTSQPGASTGDANGSGDEFA